MGTISAGDFPEAVAALAGAFRVVFIGVFPWFCSGCVVLVASHTIPPLAGKLQAANVSENLINFIKICVLCLWMRFSTVKPNS